jgi:hypothetical protein
VKESIQISIKYAALLASLIFCGYLFYATSIVTIFTDDQTIYLTELHALRWFFAATHHCNTANGSVFSQAVGEAKKSCY